MSNTRQTTKQEQDVLSYLNAVRDSGATNMFGATPYILKAYTVDKNEAKRLLLLWMSNFNEEGNYKNVKV